MKNILFAILIILFLSCSSNKTQLNLSTSAIKSRGIIKEEESFTLKKIHEYQKEAVLNPKSFLPFYNIGVLYEQDGNYSEAKKYYKKALSIDNLSASAHYNLGSIYLKEENNFKAYIHLQKADSIENNAQDILNNLEMSWYRLIRNGYKINSISRNPSEDNFFIKFPNSKFTYAVIFGGARLLQYENPEKTINILDSLLSIPKENQFNANYIRAESFYLKGLIFSNMFEDGNTKFADSALVAFDSSISYKTDRLFQSIINIQKIYSLKSLKLSKGPSTAINESSLLSTYINICNSEIKYAKLQKIIKRKDENIDYKLLENILKLYFESLERLIKISLIETDNLKLDTLDDFEKFFIKYQTESLLSRQIISTSKWISTNFSYLKDIKIVGVKLQIIFMQEMKRWRELEENITAVILANKSNGTDFLEFIDLHNNIMMFKGTFNEGIRMLLSNLNHTKTNTIDLETDFNSRINVIYKLSLIEKEEISLLQQDLNYMNSKIDSLKSLQDSTNTVNNDEVPEEIIIKIGE